MTQDEWNTCVDGAAMLESASGVDRKLLVTAACACARLALHLVPEWEERPLRALEAAEGWTKGEVGIEVVKDAARSASAACTASMHNRRRRAAYDASSAVVCAVAAAYVNTPSVSQVASYAAEAVTSAAEAVASAANVASGVKALSRCADIVRTHIPYQLVAISILEEV